MNYSSEPRKRCRFVRFIKFMAKAAVVLVVIAVPVVWLGAPKLARTKWAREKIEDRATKVVGAPVQVENVDFTWGGGFVLRNVRVSGASAGEFVAGGTIGELNVRPSVTRLCCKTPHFTVVAREPRLQLTYAEKPVTISSKPVTLKPLHIKGLDLDTLKIENGSVTIDHPSFNEPIKITNIQAQAGLETRPGYLQVDLASLTATLNGGTAKVSGCLGIRNGSVGGTVALDAKSVELNDFVVEGLRRIDPLIEVMPGNEARGAADIKFDGRMEASNFRDAFETATGSGELHLFGANLQSPKILAAAASSLQNPEIALQRFYESNVRFKLEKCRIVLSDAVAVSSKGVVKLSGSIGLDKKLDLIVGIDPAYPGGAWQLLHVVGTVDSPEIGN